MIDLTIPYAMGEMVNRIHTQAKVLSESYEENGIHVKAECPSYLADLLDQRLNNGEEEA